MSNWFGAGHSVFGKRRNKQIPKTSGFSEIAMRGLEELDARLPPPDIETKPAFTPSYKRTERLSKEPSAGGGLLIDSEGNKVPHYWAHRKRLRTRFLAGGHKPMPEYEVLELLLFNAIERIDVKPLAKRLLSAFGDLNGVVAASEHRLLKVEGTTKKGLLSAKAGRGLCTAHGTSEST